MTLSAKRLVLAERVTLYIIMLMITHPYIILKLRIRPGVRVGDLVSIMPECVYPKLKETGPFSSSE